MTAAVTVSMDPEFCATAAAEKRTMADTSIVPTKRNELLASRVEKTALLLPTREATIL
ncbi:MAG: hypothetical protein HY962_08340 [Ignavibacteriae bacterium]|nr:hypothetical protein [Ignavibacteriota bacterium]